MANQFQLWRQTNATGLASNQPASPFNNAETALISAPVDPRQLYLPQVIVINALLIISASVQLRDPTFQNQQVRQQPLVNTAQGSPRALLSGVVVTLPSGKQQLASAPAFIYQPADTSHGTPPPLLSSLKPLLTVQHAEPIENATQLWDTSRGSDIALLTAVVATKPPFVHPSQAPIRSAYQPLDTSQGTPKPLYSDALFAPTNLTEQFSIIQRFGIGLDTSAGTPLTLRATPVAAPFIPYPWLITPSIEWQPADSSQRSPQTLLNPAPFVPARHIVPAQVNWKAADTSQSSPTALLTQSAIPFTAPPHQAPITNTTQPADTTHGTPQPLLALLLVKPFNQNDWPSPIEMRVDWLQQWTFYGQNPDNIPVVVIPPVVEKDFFPGIGGAKRYKDRERKHYLVEIDGEDFYVASASEAHELLAQAQEIAEQKAQFEFDRSLTSRLRPMKLRQVIAHKLQAPVIRVPQAEIDPTAAAIEAQARAIQANIAQLYADIARSIEIGVLLRKQLDDDDEDAITVLLL